MKLLKKLNRYKPLFYNKQGVLILSKGNSLFSLQDGELVKLCSLPDKMSNKLLFASKLWIRLTRYGVLCATEYNGAYYFAFNNHIYRFDLATRTLSLDFEFENGRGPLKFTVIENIKGFENGIYFGEYIANRAKKPVKIYRRTDAWSVVYVFPEGEINHVHSLVVDKDSQKIWLLAGDFDNSAAIYSISNYFQEVEPIVYGEQKFRACVAFPYKGGLLYATDTQMEKNSIRLLQFIEKKWHSTFVADINGSCIYGCEIEGNFVFSTSTEPTEKINNKYMGLLDNQPAPGIMENKSDIILYSKESDKVEVIYSAKKDFLPYRLFQFGTIMFPENSEKTDQIYAYFVGSKKHDLTTLVFQKTING